MNQSFHNLLFVSQSLFNKRLYAALQGTGLSSGQPKVLEYLNRNDGSVPRLAFVIKLMPKELMRTPMVKTI